MESASVVGILSSWEVIVAGLLLMFLLPLVFAVASLKSPSRRPAQARGAVARPASMKAPAAPRAEAESESEDIEDPRGARRGDRRAERGPEDTA